MPSNPFGKEPTRFVCSSSETLFSLMDDGVFQMIGSEDVSREDAIDLSYSAKELALSLTKKHVEISSRINKPLDSAMKNFNSDSSAK